MHDRCKDRRVRVAETDIAAIDACSCGVFQLHLGSFSIRFTESGLAKLHETVTQALRVVGQLPEASDTDPLVLTRGQKRGIA